MNRRALFGGSFAAAVAAILNRPVAAASPDAAPGYSSRSNQIRAVSALEEASRHLWATHKGAAQVVLCNGMTQAIIDAAIDSYTRGWSQKFQHFPVLTGNITFQHEPSMPTGTLLILPATAYPDWERAMRDAVAVVNIGPARV